MLAELFRLAPKAAFRAGVVVVAAHPDDETIGAGGLLAHLPEPWVVHVTDGAPPDRRWWGAPEAPSREAYARLRADELGRALGLAGVAPERRRALGRVDQGASRDLAALADEVEALLRELRPGVVLTHPYEGGHPDHDATAFAVHAARARLGEEGAAPRVVEFTSYHARGGGVAVSGFLSGGRDVVTLSLSPSDQERKQRMMECFVSQRETLAPFPVSAERFRLAPAYDFTRAPHPGPLHYERFDWGVTGPEWRARAAGALAAVAGGAPC